MKRIVLAMLAAAALPAAAQQHMAPYKEPVPSPSDLRAASGEDRPQGQAREDRTPSPSDLATEQPRVDGDRQTDEIQDPRKVPSGAGGPIRENYRGEPIRP